MAYARHGSADTMARGLGWFSIALGMAELAMPRTLTRSLGMQGSERLMSTYGLREVATGIGILCARDPTPWVWGRVAGDALDLGTLATALDGGNPRRENVGLAFATVLGATALDVICATSLSMKNRRRAPVRDYSDRSGLPRPAAEMRGAARDFDVPADMRTPEPLQPYGAG